MDFNIHDRAEAADHAFVPLPQELSTLLKVGLCGMVSSLWDLSKSPWFLVLEQLLEAMKKDSPDSPAHATTAKDFAFSTTLDFTEPNPPGPELAALVAQLHAEVGPQGQAVFVPPDVARRYCRDGHLFQLADCFDGRPAPAARRNGGRQLPQQQRNAVAADDVVSPSLLASPRRAAANTTTYRSGRAQRAEMRQLRRSGCILSDDDDGDAAAVAAAVAAAAAAVPGASTTYDEMHVEHDATTSVAGPSGTDRNPSGPFSTLAAKRARPILTSSDQEEAATTATRPRKRRGVVAAATAHSVDLNDGDAIVSSDFAASPGTGAGAAARRASTASIEVVQDDSADGPTPAPQPQRPRRTESIETSSSSDPLGLPVAAAPQPAPPRHADSIESFEPAVEYHGNRYRAPRPQMRPKADGARDAGNDSSDELEAPTWASWPAPSAAGAARLAAPHHRMPTAGGLVVAGDGGDRALRTPSPARDAVRSVPGSAAAEAAAGVSRSLELGVAPHVKQTQRMTARPGAVTKPRGGTRGRDSRAGGTVSVVVQQID
ncbi:hypothetical protein HK405_001484 [Cladochytrium tenue]|nr:hypothetical protein HK405_001484 [Cladochytrium tenue]